MKEYVQIIKGHYDDNGAVKAIDILNATKNEQKFN